MALQNLFRNGQLKEHETDRAENQTLPTTIGLSNARLVVLDAFRRKRNLTDYTGADIDEGSALACTEQAEQLLDDVLGWLVQNRYDLMGE